MRWFSRGPVITDELWEEALHRHPLVARFEKARNGTHKPTTLRALSEKFLRSMQIRWAPGLERSDHVRVSLAMLACLPVLNLDLRWYRRWRTVLIVPRDYETESMEVDEAGVVHEGVSVAAGEYSEWGTVVIALEDLEESGLGTGFNVVIHECAHVLDNANGALDGMPPLHPGMDAVAWSTVFGDAFTDLQRRVIRGRGRGSTRTRGGGGRRSGHRTGPGRRTAFDPYAAEAPEEFFAVASELFFERPRTLEREYPGVYRQLALFYRQDNINGKS